MGELWPWLGMAAARARRLSWSPGAMNAFSSFSIKYVLPREVAVRLFGSVMTKMLGIGSQQSAS